MKKEDEAPQPEYINAVDWAFDENQFKKDEAFENPGIEDKWVSRAVDDGLLKLK